MFDAIVLITMIQERRDGEQWGITPEDVCVCVCVVYKHSILQVGAVTAACELGCTALMGTGLGEESGSHEA